VREGKRRAQGGAAAHRERDGVVGDAGEGSPAVNRPEAGRSLRVWRGAESARGRGKSELGLPGGGGGGICSSPGAAARILTPATASAATRSCFPHRGVEDDGRFANNPLRGGWAGGGWLLGRLGPSQGEKKERGRWAAPMRGKRGALSIFFPFLFFSFCFSFQISNFKSVLNFV
jgi:hypothetical protein